MLYFTLLCLAGSVLAQPTVYLTQSGIEYPWSFYNRPVVVADVAANGIPEAPLLEPLSLVRTISLEDPENRKVDVIVTEKKKEDETEGKPEEEIKEEEPKEEEEKSGGMKEEKRVEKIVIAPDMRGKPTLVKLDLSQIPQWANNFWSNLPISLPHITFPHIFGKPPPSLPTLSEASPAVEETIRYLNPSLISPPYVRVVSAK